MQTATFYLLLGIESHTQDPGRNMRIQKFQKNLLANIIRNSAYIYEKSFLSIKKGVFQ